MSKFNSPFLNENSPENIGGGGQERTIENNMHGLASDSNISNNDIEMSMKKDSSDQQYMQDNNISESGNTLSNNKGSIEIREDHKGLKRTVIILVVLLILLLLGIVLYNMLKGRGKGLPISTKMIKTEKNIDGTNFEMKGQEFKAGSVIVD